MTSIAVSLLIALAAWAYPIHAASSPPNTVKTNQTFTYDNQSTQVVKEEVKEPQKINQEVVNPTPSSVSVAPQPQVDVRPVLHAPKSNAVRNTKAQRTVPRSNTPYSGRNYSKEEVKDLIRSYSQQYGINPEVPLCIAYYESGYNQHSKNKRSSASGVFQYLSSTWKGTDEGKAGRSVFDADANVKAGVKYMASRKSTQPWEVRHKCPKLK